MKTVLRKVSLGSAAALVLCSFALPPGAEAARKGGGGGGGKAHAQANHGRADARTNNVRSGSVNNVNRSSTNRNVNRNTNVNVDRNTNINVDVDRGCCGGWDNDYHPVATAAAVTATVAVTSAVIGSMVRTVPAGCVPVNYGGIVYQQCGSTWYQPQGSQFVVIAPPY